MGLFSSKPKMKTIKLKGKTIQYMEFVKGYPLPDDVNILENMVTVYRTYSTLQPTKSDIREGYIERADFYDIVIKYFQKGGRMDLDTISDALGVSYLMIYYGISPDSRYFEKYINPETIKNKALGLQIYKKAAEQFLTWPREVTPQNKLGTVCTYLTLFPDSYEYITGIMAQAAEKEMDQCIRQGQFIPEYLGTTAVLEYLEHDWPAFYEAEFGCLPEGAPETVSGILKKYNLTPAQYYEKAAKGGGGKDVMRNAVDVTPACVIDEILKKEATGDVFNDSASKLINRFDSLLGSSLKKEIYKNQRKDLLADSCIQHMFADIGLAAFMLDDHVFPDSLPAFKGVIAYDSKGQLVTCSTTGSLTQHRLATAGYARMMRRYGFPESIYKDNTLGGEFTLSHVYKTQDRANDLKMRTKAAKSVLFEPEL